MAERLKNPVSLVLSSTFDFHKAEKLIETGENAARKEISNYLNSY